MRVRHPTLKILGIRSRSEWFGVRTTPNGPNPAHSRKFGSDSDSDLHGGRPHPLKGVGSVWSESESESGRQCYDLIATPNGT